MTKVAIIGGGIAGLALAMNLHERGIDCVAFERAPEVKELGVGITLLPHCVREFDRLGLLEALSAVAIVNRESRFFNRFGQMIYAEPRGRYAGYDYPELGIHRGKLHMVLYQVALKRLGAERVRTGATCMGVDQDDAGVTVRFSDTVSGKAIEPFRADIAVACDGVNSTIRRQFYPDDKVAFGGINTWRGVTRMPPILGGDVYMRVGSIKTGKIVIYPIVDNVDGQGNQLINWMAEIEGDRPTRNDWNQPGSLEDFFHIYKDWSFDWLDVAGMIRRAETILEYPMVDKDPVDRWTFGRVTLAGDAAHPMYPRGSNGAAQGSIDARVLADCLAADADPVKALKAYEAERLPRANKVVLTNRSNPPDFINIRVEELVGDRPFENLDDYITQAELRALSDNYKKVAGFALDDLKTR